MSKYRLSAHSLTFWKGQAEKPLVVQRRETMFQAPQVISRQIHFSFMKLICVQIPNLYVELHNFTFGKIRSICGEHANKSLAARYEFAFDSVMCCTFFLYSMLYVLSVFSSFPEIKSIVVRSFDVITAWSKKFASSVSVSLGFCLLFGLCHTCRRKNFWCIIYSHLVAC